MIVSLPVTRPLAAAREVVDFALSVTREVAEHLIYNRLRRRLGIALLELEVAKLERRIAAAEDRAEARKVVRFPRKDAA